MSWCFIEMEVDSSKYLLMLAVAEIPFDVKQNKCTKNSASYHISAGKARRLWMPEVNQIMETRLFCPEIYGLFESEEWPSMELNPNHGGAHDKTMTHRQFINSRSLSLLHGARPEEVPQKM
jgi:hypothetical protein